MGINAHHQASVVVNPSKAPALPLQWEAGWAAEPVWEFWRREKSPRHTALATDKALLNEILLS